MQSAVATESGKAALPEDSPALSSQDNEAAGTPGQRPVTKRTTAKLSKDLWSSSKSSKAMHEKQCVAKKPLAWRWLERRKRQITEGKPLRPSTKSVPAI